jgi:BMFP domain-containing protein YqiC
MDKKVAADVAYLREKADHFRKLAAKARADLNPMTERLEKLANDLDAKADEIRQGGDPL